MGTIDLEYLDRALFQRCDGELSLTERSVLAVLVYADSGDLTAERWVDLGDMSAALGCTGADIDNALMGLAMREFVHFRGERLGALVYTINADRAFWLSQRRG